MASAGNGRRVLFIVENLPSPFDRRVWQEATTLRGAGYLVSIICPTGEGCHGRYEVIEDIHIYRYNLPLEARGVLGFIVEYPAALLGQFLLACRVFRTRGFDVIHACNPPDNIFMIGVLFKVLGKKFIFDHHDLCPELYVAKFGRRDVLYRLLLLLERWTFRIADISIAPNDSYREMAIGRGGMNPEAVFVVRSGPSLERMRIMPPVTKLKRGRRFLVGYVGVMGQQDGVHLLLRGAQYIVHELGRSDVQFGLVGAGPELPYLKRLVRELQLEDYVTFTGRVPDSEMLEMLNSADVCVNPDIYSEMNDKSTMNKIMEYMALGKPIVQFDLTEGRISAQSASLYAKPDDEIDLAVKILELLDNPAMRESMGRFGRNRVENELQWKCEAPKLLAAYEACFRKHQAC